MKVVLSVVSLSRVVTELLDAMSRSIDCFSQDRSFNFRLVRIDRFLVPPRYVERYDDACTSYWDTTHEHPPNEKMEPLLLRVRPAHSLTDDNHLQYAAVMYRSSASREGGHWGAYFYFLQSIFSKEPPMFIRLDCRENNKGGAPDTLDLSTLHWLSRTDCFSLPWVLAWAAKQINFEGQPKHYSERNPLPSIPEDEAKFARAFQCFRSGLGEIGTLTEKAGDKLNQTRFLRYAWACAAMPNAEPSPMPGVSQHLEKLFMELNTNE